jgi:hypothetical protein
MSLDKASRKLPVQPYTTSSEIFKESRDPQPSTTYTTAEEQQSELGS